MRMIANNFSNNGLIRLKNNEWIEKQRISGKVAAKTLCISKQLVENRTNKSLIELDKIAYEHIKDNKCEPTFLGYKGFPNTCCISVNQQLVHGIASNTPLQEGDMISFDLGAEIDGVI